MRTIRIKVLGHEGSDLLIAMSDDLQGLMVPGRSLDELERKLPAAIRELLEATGHTVLSLTMDDDQDGIPAEFHRLGLTAKAEVRQAA